MKSLAALLVVALCPTLAIASTDARDGIIAFTSESCAACQRDKAELQSLDVRVIDVDQQPDVASQYNVTRLPTYVVERDGVEVYRTNGLRTLRLFLLAAMVWLVT